MCDMQHHCTWHPKEKGGGRIILTIISREIILINFREFLNLETVKISHLLLFCTSLRENSKQI